MAEASPDKAAAAKLMNFFITDHEANDILLIERGVTGDASIRERHPAQPDRRPSRRSSPISTWSRPMSARCRRRRRRTPARSTARLRPAWEAVAFGQVGPEARRQELLRRRRRQSSSAPEAGDGDRFQTMQAGELLRPPARGPLGPGLAPQRHRLSFLLPWLIGFFAPDAGADAGLALPVVHRLRPAEPAALVRAEELRLRLHPRPAALERAVGDLQLRGLVGAAEAGRGAGPGHGARPLGARRRLLPRHLLPAVAAGRLGRHRGAVAADLRRRRADQLAALRGHRLQGPAWVSHPALRAVDADRRWRSGSSARR